MRRKDRELTQKEDIQDIIQLGNVCRIAMFAEEYPYIIPLNYGYEWNDQLKLYFHCAQEGRKVDLLKVNNNVGFEIDIDHELVTANEPCGWGMKYKSVVGNGKMIEITSNEEKTHALDLLMEHHGFKGKPVYPAIMLTKIKIYCLEVHNITGKART